MVNIDVTSKDLRNYRLINGPCKGCLIGKSRQPSSQKVSSVTYPLGHLLMMDIFFFYGAAGRKEPYLISVESRTGHIVTARLPAKTTNELSTTIQDVVNFYKSKGHTVKLIRTDREANLLACEDFLSSIGVSMQRTGTGCHVKQAERAIRTIKDKCRATKFSLGWTLPRSLHQHLIVDVVQSMNDTVNVNSAPSTPNILVSGSRANYKYHYPIPFGTFCIVKTPLHRERDDQPRAVVAVCLGRDRRSQKSIKVLVLLTQQIIHVVKYTIIDVTKDLIKQMDDMANSEPASGEDLLADDAAILSGAERTFDVTEPTVSDIIEHQVVEDHDLDEGLHPAERHVSPNAFEYFDLQPDDEPFHGNVTEDDSEPPAQPDATPAAFEQPQQLLPASTNVPQVLEPRQSQPLVFPNNNQVEVTPSPSVPRPRKTRQPQPIIPTTRVLRSMVPKSPTPEPSPPTFARSFFVDTVTTIPDELVHNVTVQEAKSIHGDKVDEIRSLVDDTHALEACRTRERALPMHLLLKAKFLANAEFDKYKARIVI